MNVDGVEYDFATDVYVTDDYKVKLGFNRDGSLSSSRHIGAFDDFSLILMTCPCYR